VLRRPFSPNSRCQPPSFDVSAPRRPISSTPCRQRGGTEPPLRRESSPGRSATERDRFDIERNVILPGVLAVLRMVRHFVSRGAGEQGMWNGYAVVDVETTGLDVRRRDRVIEIGVIQLDGRTSLLLGVAGCGGVGGRGRDPDRGSRPVASGGMLGLGADDWSRRCAVACGRQGLRPRKPGSDGSS
jgi:hypothetical protein